MVFGLMHIIVHILDTFLLLSEISGAIVIISSELSKVGNSADDGSQLLPFRKACKFLLNPV